MDTIEYRIDKMAHAKAQRRKELKLYPSLASLRLCVRYLLELWMKPFLCSSVFIGGLLQLIFAHSAFAWEGHKWEDWQRISTWRKPVLKTDQVGREELVSLLAPEQTTDNVASSPSSGPSQTRIDEIRVWESKAGRYAAAIKAILGDPGKLEVPSPEGRVIGEQQFDGYKRLHIRIRSEADDWIPAYLLIPSNAPAGRLPTMICVHQTVAQGKDETVGIKGDPQLAFAEQLVRRGYVCIAPDMIGFGERIPPGKNPYHDSQAFYRKHPRWSFMGKMVWDMSRVVDYLRTLPFVDPRQIGSIGHSHGAYTTLFAAAFEPRISLAVASCGFTTLRSDPNPERWSHLTALIPQLGAYLPNVKTIPFDWQHICGLIAPRPLFIWYATQDTIFPKTDNLDSMLQDVRGVYGLYGAADDLAWNAFVGPHKFPDDGREMVYRWLDERFFTVGDIHTVPANVEEWRQKRELIRRVISRSLGRLPTDSPPLYMKVIESTRQESCERRLIEYTVQKGEQVRAYLCIPHAKSNAYTSKGLPGVLVLHQTIAAGKRESMGLEGSPSLAFAADLAARGYITLAPDSITAGQRVDMGKPFDTRMHYIRHPDLSAMGKMLYDSRRALDLLAGIEGVDAGRLGAIGHSLGAEEVMMLAAFDERIKAAVASCGYATFEADPNRMCWARDRWFSYMPKLRPIFLRNELPAWDWPDVLRLIAPRAFYQHTTMSDEIFKESRSAYAAGEAARPIWQLYDATDRLANVLKPGKHGIADDTRKDMYEWLDRQLGNETTDAHR